MSDDKEVIKFTPKLLGYEKGRQARKDLIPGGFLTIVDIDLKERNLIRSEFQRTLQKMNDIGIMARPSNADNLVWDSATKTLYWLGFRNWGVLSARKLNNHWLWSFDLVKIPENLLRKRNRQGWDSDTTGWIW
ncbi:hypothetical protein N7499_012695 [Penicillium canescens]|nr:hypothetical protein N7499_012695 [Penicillium canescens]